MSSILNTILIKTTPLGNPKSQVETLAKYLTTRDLIPLLIARIKPGATGAEIGVREGYFSDTILNGSKCAKLYSIDPWREFDKSDYKDISNAAQAKQDDIMRQCQQRLAKYGDRSEIIRETSIEASRRFNPVSLDFAYIDAQHHYQAVKDDIAAWAPLIRQGGLLMGHDYVDGELPAGSFGVKSAVDEFASSLGLAVHTTQEGEWKSWIIHFI